MKSKNILHQNRLGRIEVEIKAKTRKKGSD